MSRRFFIILLAVFAVLVIVAVSAAAVFLYFTGKGGITVDFRQSSAQTQVQPSNGKQGGANDEAGTAVTTEMHGDTGLEDPTAHDPAEAAVKLVHTEEIEVGNNSPEFDLKAWLCVEEGGRTYLKLEYYVDGASAMQEYDQTLLPELKDLFFLRASLASTDSEAYQINRILLNPRHSKVYAVITGSAKLKGADVALYSLNLAEGTARRLVSLTGKISGLFLNRKMSYLGFSYAAAESQSISGEKSFLEIVDCAADSLVVHQNRDGKGKPIGQNRETKLAYDLELKAWKTDSVLQLLAETHPVAGNTPAGSGKPFELLYDLARNLFLNPDGTAMQPAAVTPKPGETPQPSKHEALDTLKLFYLYLASEKDYSKALDILDNDFRLELDLLKQFQVEELRKSDIDLDSASLFSDLLKSARMDMVVKEEAASSQETTLYYYQQISLDAQSQVKQALAATMRKNGGQWKILRIQEVDSSKAPFTQ